MRPTSLTGTAVSECLHASTPIANGNGFVRAGIVRVLESVDGIECVGEVGSVARLVTRVERPQADLVLLDMHLPGIEVQFALGRIRDTNPDVRVIVLAFQASPVEMQRVGARGASGVILKTIAVEVLAGAIRQIVHGAQCADIAPRSGHGRRADHARAAEFAGHRSGHSNKVVARELFVTEQTVKFHLTNVYRKLRLTNRTEAAPLGLPARPGVTRSAWPPDYGLAAVAMRA